MNIRLCTGLAAMVALSLASCYPYDENQGNKKPTSGPEKKLSPEEEAKMKEAAAKKKAEDALKKKKERAAEDTSNAGGAETTPPSGGGTTTPSPEPKKRTSWPTAIKVPGREGFVISPYNNKEVDVRGMPSGAEVGDPFYPEADMKHFIVP